MAAIDWANVTSPFTDDLGRTWTKVGNRWTPDSGRSGFIEVREKVDSMWEPPTAPFDGDQITGDDQIAVFRDGQRIRVPASSIVGAGAGSSGGGSAQIISDASGTVQLDLAAYPNFVITTAGSITIEPLNEDTTGFSSWTFTVIVSSASHAIAVSGMDADGLGFDDLTMETDTILIGTITKPPGYFSLTYEVRVPLDTSGSAVTVGSKLPSSPPTETPPPTGNHQLAYYPDASDWSEGAGTVLNGQTFGANGLQDVIFLALYDAYNGDVLSVRYFIDPTDVPALSTWSASYPTLGDNGFIGGGSTAPRNKSIVATGESDGTKNLYAQVRLKSTTTIDVINATFVVDNTGSVTTPPEAPTIDDVTAGNRSLVVDFTDSSTGTLAYSHELQYGLTNPPTSTPALFQSGGSLQNLSGGTLYYLRVRGIAQDGTKGVWSSVSSGTPTGEAVSSSGTGVTRDATPANAKQMAVSTFGPRLAQNGVAVPYKDQRSNAIKFKPANVETVIRSLATSWQQKATNYASSMKASNPLGHWTSAAERDAPQRAVITGSLAYTSRWVTRDGKQVEVNLSAKSDPLATLLDMAKTARGDYSGFWANAGNAATELGIAHLIEIDIAHEPNGGWYPTYCGQQDALIGLSKLSGATNAEWGPEIGQALRDCAVDGDRGPVMKLAFEEVARTLRDTAPEIAIGITFAAGDAEPPGGGTDTAPSSGTSWNWSSWAPDPSLVDVINVDAYCRASGRPVGGGNSQNHFDWTFNGLDALFDQLFTIVGSYGCAWGVGEFAPMFDDWQNGTTQAETCTDLQAAVWWDHFWWRVENAPANCQRIATINYWQATGDKKPGTTFRPSPIHHPKYWARLQADFPLVK
jgi:hypothetical protein